MNKKPINLIKISPYLLYGTPVINLEQGYTEVGKERFLAIALEKSKAAKDWEDTDCFKIIIVVQGADRNYYISEIEHPADILAPKYVNDDMRIWWVEENAESKDRLFVNMISNLYALNDSRSQYTLTINDKPYQFCEKYIIYKMSASYEIWDGKVTIDGINVTLESN
ncbi:hypothetical protein I4641_18760 [Waterburya agarophytonicola K14]|uniref:Uncharacterized protein n=1 Tax=Waterburya agarophytonicola KI4 TaxID=2874699 RepID=A0A964BSN6_9CYAN|nr:hypothetical protein [Waterburya agarophytonicola]MCC0179013.1 hypothetical protein [Waterburya agarophytonicola KI4]